MKICFVVPRVYIYFNTEITNNAGGAERQIYYLGTELSKNNNFDVNFCVADFGQKPIETINKSTLWRSFKPTENRIKGFLKLIKTLKKINADKYIFRSADFGTAIALFSVRFLLKKKTIYMIASNSETLFKDLKKMSGFLTAVFMPLAYKFSNMLTSQTETQYNLFKKNRNIIPNSIIHNIVNITDIQDIKQSKKKHIIWIGRLDKVKQPYFYSELAKKFPEENFIMIAPVIKEDEKFGLEFKKSIQNIKNLKHIEYVSPDKITDYYKSAKAYVITSYTEGFSNTMAEAMANYCPVLSLNINPDNIFSKYEIGFCANNNSKLFYEYFEKIINNVDLRTKFATNALNYLIENHNKEKIITKFTNEILLKN
ncbi:MAG: glycosyltransferase [Bacteroidales bacterium]|nr:glycosyltransferase [Bacteroidales bacterium]MBN2756503.1 glycosyltransferase [Bacteroidales bacterium]